MEVNCQFHAPPVLSPVKKSFDMHLDIKYLEVSSPGLLCFDAV